MIRNARPAAHSWRRTAWSIALWAVAAGLCALQEASAPPVSVDLISLLQLWLPQRPIEAQLTGGLRYAPFSGRASPAAAPTASASLGTRGAADRKEPTAAVRARVLRATAGRRRSSRALAAAGIAYLLLPGGEEAAVSNLEQAARLDRHDPRIASDLAAAYLARSAEDPKRQTEDLFLAVETASRAVVADPGLREGRFNLALALEKLGLVDEARRTWSAYLSAPPAEFPATLAGWQEEALGRLRGLERSSRAARWREELPRLERACAEGNRETLRSLAALYGPQVRERAELDLLTWSAAQRRGDRGEEQRALGCARTLGEALGEVGHDPLIADAVRAIDRAARDLAHPARLTNLVQGQLELAAGLQHRRDRDWQAAVSDLRRAARKLRRAGTPLSALARLHLAICELSGGASDAALATLRALASDEDYRADLDLQGRVAWTTGLALGRAGEAGASLDAYRSAVERFAAAAEPERAGEVEVRRAEVLHLLGEHTLAWQHLERAMGQVDLARSATLFAEAAELAVALGHPAVALRFQDQVIRQARAAGQANEQFYALLQRSPIVFRLGQAEHAARDLEAAASFLPRVAPAERPRLAADLARAQAELVQTREPQRAITLLTQAITEYRDLHLETLVAPLYLARAQARIAAGGDATAIEADLRASLESLEARRGKIPEESFRITFLDQSADAYDEILRLLARQGRDDEAFDYAELARGRALLEATARPTRGNGGIPSQERPLPWADVQRRLPRGVVLLEYAVLDERLLAWGWTRDDRRFFSVPLGRARLAALVDRFAAAVRSGGRAEFARLSAEIWPALVAPLSGWLPSGAALVVVPGGPLERLPFAALVDPASGKYLIEQWSLAKAPSATLYVRALARFRRLDAEPASLLILSEPAFDPASFPDLAPLPFAGDEGASIAALYPPGAVLHVHGERATRDLFLARAGSYSIVHFAGHTLLDSTAARRSRLIFAGPEERAVLGPEEIERGRLSRTRLVVLSACATAAGPSSRSEGMLSLARAFFAAGVPEVIATLWRIDDEAAAHLFVAFHRHLRAGEGVPAALRSAQLELLGSSDDKLRSPASWAAAEAIGGALATHEP